MNPSTTTLDLNVGYPNIATICHAVQGDAQSRIITANLYDGGVAWTPPEGAIGIIKFRTALGTSGVYDTDEEGNTAVTWSGNVATLRIVQNALAVAGDVPMQLTFYDANDAVLTTFLWETLVQPSVLTDTQFMQTDYYNILSQQISAILAAIADIPEPSTSTPLMDGTAAAGTQNTFARGDHRHPTDTSRASTSVATQSANGLMSSADKTKLDGIASGAQVNTVTGVKGNSESSYRTGNVNITKANIGLGNVDNTSDASKLSSTATDIKMDGTQSAGSSSKAAKADHVHPTDTSRVPTTRKINNLDLSQDRTLTAENIGYDGTLGSHTENSVGAELSDLNAAINEPLKGKTINIWGDSLSMPTRWPSLLQNYGNPTVNNHSVSGAWLASRTGVDGMAQTVLDATGSTDTNVINILAVGTNDFRNQVDLGSTSGAITTVFGAMEQCCSKMIELFPNAINVFCIPPRCAGTADGAVSKYTMSLMGQGLSHIAKRYGFVLIDLFNGLPNYNPNVGRLKSKWTNNQDGVHPTDAYVPEWAKYVVSHLNPPKSDAIPTNYAGWTYTPSPAKGTLTTSRFEKFGEQYCRAQVQLASLTNRSGLTTTVINDIPFYLYPSGVAPLTCMYRKDGETFNRVAVCYAYQNSIIVVFDDSSTDITSVWINGIFSVPTLPTSTP